MRRLWLAALVPLLGCSVSPLGELPNEDADESALPEDECDALLGYIEGLEGDYVEQDRLAVSGTRTWCEYALHSTAGSAGSTLEVALTTWTASSAAWVTVLDLIGNVVAHADDLAIGDTVSFSLDRSGEYFIRVGAMDLQEPPNDYGVGVSCVDGCEGRYTRYPVVLIHGMAGADAYLGAYPYWYQVLPDLQDDGYLAFTPAVDAVAPPPSRAQQWSAILDQLEADGMGRRFNLIAHSQGGIDARYMATTLAEGDRIASITTVATPHYGTGLADVANGVIETTPIIASLVEEGVSALTNAIGLGEAQLLFATEAVTRPAMEQFNDETPDHPSVRYFSWSARSCGFTEFGCQGESGGEVVAPYLVPTYRALQLLDGPNDGIVPTASGIWGEHLGTIGADHFDEVGQLAGQTDGNFDHRAFYLGACFRLYDEGL